MHFDKQEYTRLARTYWTSLVLLGINGIVAGTILVVYALAGRVSDVLLASNGLLVSSLTLYLTSLTAIGSLLVIMSTLPRFDQLHKIKEPIERLMTAFEACGITTRSLSLFADFTGHVISVRRRTAGGFTVVVQTPQGTIQRELVVQRYRIDKGVEVGEELAVTELEYIIGLMKFFEGQVAGERVLSKLDYDSIPVPGSTLGRSDAAVGSRVDM